MQVKQEGQIHYGGAVISALAYFLTVLRENGIGRRKSVFFCGYAPFAGIQQVLAGHRHKGRERMGRRTVPRRCAKTGRSWPGGGTAGGWNRPLWEQTVSLLLPFCRLEQRFTTCSRKKAFGEKGRPLAWILQRFRPDTFEMRFSRASAPC